MADLTRSVDIVFGSVDKLSPALTSIKSGLADFDASVQRVAAPVAEVGNKILVLETAVLALSAAFVGSSIEAAGKFGDSITEIGTLFGGTTDQMKGFSDNVLNYAGSSTQSIESINGAIYEAVSSGVSWGDSIEFVRKNEELAAAGRANLTDVTNVMTGVLNAYGEKGKDTAESIKILSEYQDDFMTAVNIGKTTVPEMAASLSQVSTIASAAGVPFSDLAAAIATVTSKGVPTSEAMTMIRGVLDTMIKPSSEAVKYASELGIAFDVQNVKSKGLKGALDEIITATGGSSENMAKLFGNVEGLNGALILGKTGSEDFANALNTMANNTGAVATSYEAMSKNYEVAMQRMANAADVAMIKAGQPLLDEFGGVANGIAAVFQNLGQGIDSGAFAPIIGALEAFGQSASTTLGDIAKNLPEALANLDFGPLLSSLDSLGGSIGDAFENIFGEIDLSTPEGLSSALQTIVDGIAGLTNVTAGIVDGFAPIFTAFGDLAREANGAGAESQNAAGQFIAVAQQIMSFGAGLTAALTLMQETGTSIVSVIDVFAGGVRVAFNGVQIGIDGIGAIILTMLQKISEGFALVLPGDIGERWAEKAAQFGGLLDDLAERNGINTAEMAAGWEQVQRGLDGVGGKMTDTAGSATTLAQSTDVATTSGAKFVGIDWGQSATGIDYVGEAAKRLGLSLSESGPAAENFGKYIKTAADDADIARAKTNGYRLEIDELGNRTFIPVIEGQKKTNEELKNAQKEMEAAAKKAVDYDLKLQEISSKERIAYVEAKFKLDEAQINADAQKVVAAFESINTSISSTGETLSSLVSSWASIGGTFEGQKLWDLIENEEKRRQEAFEQQKLLINEQIGYLKARSAAMLKGDTLLKVEAAGLTPHLERIFHEILRVCQMKANEQGLELLLGAGTP